VKLAYATSETTFAFYIGYLGEEVDSKMMRDHVYRNKYTGRNYNRDKKKRFMTCE
jgi:hypothetical protein